MSTSSRRRLLAGLSAAAMSLAAHAAGRVQVQTPAVLAPDAPIGESVKAECDIENLVATQVTNVLHTQFAGVRPATEGQRAADEPYLRLNVLWVVGGSYPGPKSLGLKAELLLGDRVLASEQFRESSMTGLSALAGNTCGKFADVAKGLGEELADWLPEVTTLEALPKRPTPVARPGARPPQPRQHDQPVPAASGYAAVDDFDAVPLREQGKQRYRHYLTLQPPKAFVISENGSWVITAAHNAAIEKSLNACVLRGSPCWLYAVDDRVVWQRDPAQRVGKPAAAEPTAKPRVARAASAAAPVESAASADLAPLAHRYPLPAATGFAAADDVEAVPLSAAGKQRYRHFLGLPPPKAFVVYAAGGWRFHARNPEAMTELLDHCARQGAACWLYAVDDRVVWSREPAQRIGSSAQVRGPRAAASAPQ